MSSADPADPADLRREILRALYLRRAAALNAHYLTQVVNRRTSGGYAVSEILRELKFCIDLKFVSFIEDTIGSRLTYTLEAEGVLYCERNDLTD